jgi:hypothetical protein
MADFKVSSFKPLSDTFGKVATSLLSMQNSGYKKNAEKAFGLNILTGGLQAVNSKLQNTIMSGIEAVKERHNEIFVQNKEEWDGSKTNRERIAEYDRDPEGFINRETAKRINSTDEFMDNDLDWNKRSEYDATTRANLKEFFNKEEDVLRNEMTLLKQNPANVISSFTKYNQSAADAFRAAIDEVKDDPTKQNAVKALWNRIFHTKRDEEGKLVSTNAEKLLLIKNKQEADERHSNFRKEIDVAQTSLDTYYSTLLNKTKNELDGSIINKVAKPFSVDAVTKQKNLISEILNGPDSKKIFFSRPLNIQIIDTGKTIKDIKSIPTITKENSKSINIKTGAFKNIKILSKEGDENIVNSVSDDIFINRLAIQVLAMNERLIANRQQPLVGAEAIHGALQIWSNEGRFLKANQLDKGGFNLGLTTVGETNLWNSEDILFIPPGDTLIQNNSKASDAAYLQYMNGQELFNGEEGGDGGDGGGEELLEYNSLKLLQYSQDAPFAKLNSIQKKLAVQELKRAYPDKEDEISLIFKQALTPLKTSVSVETPALGSDEYIKQQEDKIRSQVGEDVTETATAFKAGYDARIDRLDRERLEKLIENPKTIMGVKPALLRKYGLNPNVDPEEIKTLLNTLDSGDTKQSLLAADVSPLDTADGLLNLEGVKALVMSESSDNPDALWKQSQKNEFKGFVATESSMDEVLDFVKLNGPYAKWSKTQSDTNKTHTPVGKYQFVGATLRDIKDRKGFEQLGITGDTQFTVDVQDKLFAWYIEDTIKAAGPDATNAEIRKKIRARWEGATEENVSTAQLDEVVNSLLGRD